MATTGAFAEFLTHIKGVPWSAAQLTSIGCALALPDILIAPTATIMEAMMVLITCCYLSLDYEPLCFAIDAR
jgi:hypothetical protein